MFLLCILAYRAEARDYATTSTLTRVSPCISASVHQHFRVVEGDVNSRGSSHAVMPCVPA
eukprot:scaffold11375_cov123-Isochrysis_galbana.AAC.11